MSTSYRGKTTISTSKNKFRTTFTFNIFEQNFTSVLFFYIDKLDDS
jgi:hypothetical protein